MRRALFVGTAGWAITRSAKPAFPADGSHLMRYASRLNAVEINSSFSRPHRRQTYERWATAVPDDFQFAVKLPRAITHERRLVDCDAELARFLEAVEGLGNRLGPLLIQLPPSLGFDGAAADAFFASLRRQTRGPAVCEPRHSDWFGAEADALFRAFAVARVAADPPPVRGADHPGGDQALIYRRLHGSPRIYASNYEAAALDRIAATLNEETDVPTWCIFDNTAAAHALGNALEITRRCRG